jgi:hypothetical protein
MNPDLQCLDHMRVAVVPACLWLIGGGAESHWVMSLQNASRRRGTADHGRRVVTGPGSSLSEEPVPGVQAGRAGDRVVPLLPSLALGTGCGAAGVGLQAGEDGVADLLLQRAQGLFGDLSLGQFLVVVGAALAVQVAGLWVIAAMWMAWLYAVARVASMRSINDSGNLV